MEHIETDGQFAPFPIGGITGKTRMRLLGRMPTEALAFWTDDPCLVREGGS
jgi:hypothetical protein